MDKEKEIEEMSILATKTIKAALGYEYGCRVETAEQQGENIANVLYEKGYRKADDVRKETAKELYDKFFGSGFTTEYLKSVMKEYGVEVE